MRFAPLWAVCGCPSPCFTVHCPAPGSVYRGVSRGVSRCGSLLSSPERWSSTCWSMSAVKDAEGWYTALPSSTREKLLFVLSSTLGSVLFFFLFESFMIIGLTDLEAREGAFIGSYLLAYVISIAWQHALHRLLVFSHQPYCLSLFHTYASYSFSLLCFAALGALLRHGLHWPPRLVVVIILPCSAVSNYYLLRACMHCSERWEEARGDQRRQSIASASSSPNFSSSDDLGYAPPHQRRRPQRLPVVAPQDAELYGLLHPPAGAASPLLFRICGARGGSQQRSTDFPLLPFDLCALSLLPLTATGLLRLIAADPHAASVADVQLTPPTRSTTTPFFSSRTLHRHPSHRPFFDAVKRLCPSNTTVDKYTERTASLCGKASLYVTEDGHWVGCWRERVWE